MGSGPRDGAKGESMLPVLLGPERAWSLASTVSSSDTVSWVP